MGEGQGHKGVMWTRVRAYIQDARTVDAEGLVDGESLLGHLPVGGGGPLDRRPEEGEALPACQQRSHLCLFFS